MSFVTDSKTPQIPAGDRSFVTVPKKKTQESDIPGYQQELDAQGNPTDSYTNGESTGTRTDALRALAKNEGVSNLNEAALEQLLAEIKAKKAKKPPVYEGKVDRAGV